MADTLDDFERSEFTAEGSHPHRLPDRDRSRGHRHERDPGDHPERGPLRPDGRRASGARRSCPTCSATTAGTRPCRYALRSLAEGLRLQGVHRPGPRPDQSRSPPGCGRWPGPSTSGAVARVSAPSGMCFTGGFALAMMVDDVVRGAGAQPAVAPVPAGPRTGAGPSASATPTSSGSPSGWPPGCACSDCASRGDKLSPPERFAALRELLGDGFVGVELDSSAGQPPRAPQDGPLGPHRGPRRPARAPRPGRHWTRSSTCSAPGCWSEATGVNASGRRLAVPGTRPIRCAGQRIFTVDVPATGPGDAPPLLVLHGFPTSSFDFHRVVDALAADRRVVLFDMLGFGLSAKPDRPYRLVDQADLAVALVADLGIDRLGLLTHDIGDTVGGELLARQLEGAWDVEVTDRVLTNGTRLHGPGPAERRPAVPRGPARRAPGPGRARPGRGTGRTGGDVQPDVRRVRRRAGGALGS